VNSAGDVVSWLSVFVLQIVVRDLRQLGDDVRTRRFSGFALAFDGWWVSSVASGAGALEAALVVDADARGSAVVSSDCAFVDV